MADRADSPELPKRLAEELAAAQRQEDKLCDELAQLEATLRARGLAEEAEDIEELRAEVESGLGKKIGNLAGGARDLAAKQWRLFSQEVGESRDVVQLIKRRLTGEISRFTEAEENLIRGQIADLFRMVPATALALAPVPGIAVITPFVLKKLNLLPSAWREANAIHRLDEAARRLRAQNQTEEAEKMEAAANALREVNSDREDRVRTLRDHPDVRLLYDFNGDNVIDDEEWEIFKADRELLQNCVAEDRAQARWFYSFTGEVEGPVALDVLLDTPLPEHTLVRATAMKRWVPMDLFLEAVFAVAEQPGEAG